MNYQRNANFLQALILGGADPIAPLARLVVLRVKHLWAGDAGMVYLVQSAIDVAEVIRLLNARWHQVEERAAELMRYRSAQ